MDHKKARKCVNEILDNFCNECFLRKHFRSEKGKTKALSFCITQCSVGEELKKYGQILENKKKCAVKK